MMSQHNGRIQIDEDIGSLKGHLKLSLQELITHKCKRKETERSEDKTKLPIRCLSNNLGYEN